MRRAGNISNVVNSNLSISAFLRKAFVLNYSVTVSRAMCPASGLSQQLHCGGDHRLGCGDEPHW